MTKFERFLDNIHQLSVTVSRLTKPKKRWNRERILDAVGIGVTIATAVASAIPQVRGVATVMSFLTVLQRTVTEVTPSQIAKTKKQPPQMASVTPLNKARDTR